MKTKEIAANILYYNPISYMGRKVGQAVGLDAAIRVLRESKDLEHIIGAPIAAAAQISFPGYTRAHLDMEFGFAGGNRGKRVMDVDKNGEFAGAYIDISGATAALLALYGSGIPGAVITKLIANVGENILLDVGTVLHRKFATRWDIPKGSTRH